MSKVTIEMNDTQARIVLQALEEWFRIRMGQNYELSNGLAFYGFKNDPNNPKAFDDAITKRNALDAVIRAMFQIAWPHYGTPRNIEPEVHIASDIWSQLRWELSDKSPFLATPFQMGSEPMPKITVEEDT